MPGFPEHPPDGARTGWRRTPIATRTPDPRREWASADVRGEAVGDRVCRTMRSVQPHQEQPIELSTTDSLRQVDELCGRAVCVLVRPGPGPDHLPEVLDTDDVSQGLQGHRATSVD